MVTGSSTTPSSINLESIQWIAYGFIFRYIEPKTTLKKMSNELPESIKILLYYLLTALAFWNTTSLYIRTSLFFIATGIKSSKYYQFYIEFLIPFPPHSPLLPCLQISFLAENLWVHDEWLFVIHQWFQGLERLSEKRKKKKGLEREIWLCNCTWDLFDLKPEFSA